jgi:hypothetical protein
MINRCSNKVSITSQDRLQPMDKWEDYHIKVLDMAPLIMVTIPTVSSFFSTCGCFLRVGWSSSEDLPPLSQACRWLLGANDSLFCEWRRLHGLRVEDPSGARKGEQTDTRTGSGRPAWADWPRPTLILFGRSFSPVGPNAFMQFSPSACTILMMSLSRPRWRFSVHEVRSFTLQSSGVFLRNTWVLATIRSDFIKLKNTNQTP